jgi:60 kDa SS-A/Ro ribonucleoprotein
MDSQHALAQYAMTGCLSNTFSATAGKQLDMVLKLCARNSVEFVAKIAVSAREEGYMKDLPALLLAYVYANDPSGKLFAAIFPRVVNNDKMLTNFAQIVRSGTVGKVTHFRRPARRVMEAWLDSRSDDSIFRGSVGNADPSLVDVIRLVRPVPKTESRRALYGYLSGKNPKEFDKNKPAMSGHFGYDTAALPALVQQFEAFKRDPANPAVPDVPFQMLTALPLGTPEWIRIACQSSWQTIRMNLNTFQRHGVLEDKEVVKKLAAILRDPALIRRSHVMPHQLLAAYRHADPRIPVELRNALQEALDVATENVPVIDGSIAILVDVSGSMRGPVTGSKEEEERKAKRGARPAPPGQKSGSDSTITCLDAAALIASCALRVNKEAEVIIFSDKVHQNTHFNPRDSVITNADKIAQEPSGGTNSSAPIAYLNHYNKAPGLVVMLSDYESWMDSAGRQIRCEGTHRGVSPTALMEQWNILHARNPKAKLVCVDMQPNATVQAINREDIVNFGGFSPQVFDVLAAASKDRISPTFWTDRIEQVKL